MKRLHVSMNVKNLQESVVFYSALFNASPTKAKEDYAQWLLEDPRVNFSIAVHPEQAPGIIHLGVQAETEAELGEIYENLSNARGAIREEGKTICCYAKSEKSWITDPSGVDWEAFYTFGDAAGFYHDDPAETQNNPAKKSDPLHHNQPFLQEARTCCPAPSKKP